TPISKRPSVSTDSECASHAVIHGGRSGQAYTQVPTCRSARAAAKASVGPGAGCHCGTSGISSGEEPLSAMRRTPAPPLGRSVASGATTPNRNGLVMPGLLSHKADAWPVTRDAGVCGLSLDRAQAHDPRYSTSMLPEPA